MENEGVRRSELCGQYDADVNRVSSVENEGVRRSKLCEQHDGEVNHVRNMANGGYNGDITSTEEDTGDSESGMLTLG